MAVLPGLERKCLCPSVSQKEERKKGRRGKKEKKNETKKGANTVENGSLEKRFRFRFRYSTFGGGRRGKKKKKKVREGGGNPGTT